MQTGRTFQFSAKTLLEQVSNLMFYDQSTISNLVFYAQSTISPVNHYGYIRSNTLLKKTIMFSDRS